MFDPKRKRIVLSLGGSLVVPEGGPNVEFLKRFARFIRRMVIKDKKLQFFIVVGGGSIARQYRDAGRRVVRHSLSNRDQDWLGIHATRLNAHLIKTIFKDITHLRIIKDYDVIRRVKEPVVVGAGWKPGWSTDYCAVMLCEDYGAKVVINLSNIKRVYDKDPNRFDNAKPIAKMSWEKFRQLVGSKWIPGMNKPFDPIASKKAAGLGIEVVVLKGDDLENLDRYFKGKKFIGTVIG